MQLYVRVCVPILEQGYASIIFFLINRSRTRKISFDACHPRSKQFPAPAFDSIAIEQGTPNKHYWTEQYLFKHEKRQMNCLSPSVKRRATTMEVALCQNIYNPAIFLNRNNYLLKIFTIAVIMFQVQEPTKTGWDPTGTLIVWWSIARVAVMQECNECVTLLPLLLFLRAQPWPGLLQFWRQWDFFISYFFMAPLRIFFAKQDFKSVAGGKFNSRWST